LAIRIYQGLASGRKSTIIIVIAVTLIIGSVSSWLLRVYYRHVEENVQDCEECLPRDFDWGPRPGLKLSTEFCENPDDHQVGKRRTITIRQKLIRLGAYCKGGIIYDRWGTEIRFHRVLEWGGPAPPPEMWANFQERKKQEEETLKELEKRYTVIQMWSTHIPQ
jgi:hypothetical protein